jgi:hypothetical protein
MGGDFTEVRVRKIRNQVVHRRVASRPVTKGDKLVVDVPRRLTSNPREIPVACPLALLAMTGDTTLDPCFDGVELFE